MLGDGLSLTCFLGCTRGSQHILQCSVSRRLVGVPTIQMLQDMFRLGWREEEEGSRGREGEMC